MEQGDARAIGAHRTRARVAVHRKPRRGALGGVSRRACAPASVTDVRQFDLSGPPLPRALDAPARSVLSLSQPRRLDAEGARAALEARSRTWRHEAREARGAHRHL